MLLEELKFLIDEMENLLIKDQRFKDNLFFKHQTKYLYAKKIEKPSVMIPSINITPLLNFHNLASLNPEYNLKKNICNHEPYIKEIDRLKAIGCDHSNCEKKIKELEEKVQPCDHSNCEKKIKELEEKNKELHKMINELTSDTSEDLNLENLESAVKRSKEEWEGLTLSEKYYSLIKNGPKIIDIKQ